MKSVVPSKENYVFAQEGPNQTNILLADVVRELKELNKSLSAVYDEILEANQAPRRDDY